VLDWCAISKIPFAISSPSPISARFSNSMRQESSDPTQTPPARGWSNRILSASLFGILFFTLFPYWADFSQKHSPGRSIFLLSRPLGFDGFLHTSLNALLFLPFGFALSQFFQGRRKSLFRSILVAVVAGAALSYSIEIIQLYMPSRDSAWDDVLANVLGALLGAILGSASGGFIFRKLSDWERHLEQFLSFRKISVAALIYFAVWLAVSVPLQRKTHLNNWDPNSFLFVGYDVDEDTRWSGAVSQIQLWDRALPDDQATEISVEGGSSVQAPSPFASYDFSHPPPIPDKTGQLPSLALTLPTTPAAIAHQSHNRESASMLAPLSVLTSQDPASALSATVRQSNQFSVLIRCVPGRGNDTEGAIFEIANSSGKFDFLIRQEHSSVVVSIRNALDSRKTLLAWSVPNVFIAHAGRSILYSYDGAQGFLHIDGKKISKSYYISPGASLVRELVRIKTDELVAYSVLYQSLVFLPVGFLLGLAVRKMPAQNSFYKLGIGLGVILPATLLEAVLVAVSGRQLSILQLSTSIGLTLAGMLWMNLDRSAPPSLV
jgi:glycopeptide antibiotics resistance protein